jgi:hypothetical protein
MQAGSLSFAEAAEGRPDSAISLGKAKYGDPRTNVGKQTGHAI